MTLENCKKLLQHFEENNLTEKAEEMRAHIVRKTASLTRKGLLKPEEPKPKAKPKEENNEVKKDEKPKG